MKENSKVQGNSGRSAKRPERPVPHRVNAPVGPYDCSRTNPKAWQELGYKSANAYRSSDEFRDACWSRWPTDAAWPRVLDVYEAAARLRTSPDSIRREATIGRDGKAKLAHQRIRAAYRFRLQDIDNYGQVQARLPANPAPEISRLAADFCRHRSEISETPIRLGAAPTLVRRSQRCRFPRTRL